MTRTLLVRQPRGGVPDPEWDPTDLMLVVVPIYGQRDAGRTFWKTFRGGIIESGMEENTFVPAMYFVSKEMPEKSYDVVMIMVTHVDDLAWSDTPESQEVIRCLKNKFPIEKEKTGEFKFTGHEITQDEDYTVHVRCRGTALKMDKVSLG